MHSPYVTVCCVLCLLLQDRLQSSLQGLLQDAGVQVWLQQLLLMVTAASSILGW